VTKHHPERQNNGSLRIRHWTWLVFDTSTTPVLGQNRISESDHFYLSALLVSSTGAPTGSPTNTAATNPATSTLLDQTGGCNNKSSSRSFFRCSSCNWRCDCIGGYCGMFFRFPHPSKTWQSQDYQRQFHECRNKE